ncbi:MAG TPA: formate dehydrogenase accessory sulfurtransferase FdhD, partial [Longimicrobiales bacterium]|nr:formate dehydrogenase accessory sulfurtransferase FdhD [Longimicrobiales bacterium]
RLRVNGRRLAVWTCSPGNLDALAAGRLLTSGFVRHLADILALEPLEDDGAAPGIDARLEAAATAEGFAEREHRAEHGCGLRFLLGCRPDLIRREHVAPAPPAMERFPDLFRVLYERATTYRDIGGVHTAALCAGEAVPGEALAYHQEEVGRHNAVDRVIGQALLDGADLKGFGLLTTARISGEIAEKAARAGLAWIASRSVPTTLAVEIAGRAGLSIVARAPSRDARVFGAP